MIRPLTFTPRPILPPAPVSGTNPPQPPSMCAGFVPTPLIGPGGCYRPAPIVILPIGEGWLA